MRKGNEMLDWGKYDHVPPTHYNIYSDVLLRPEPSDSRLQKRRALARDLEENSPPPVPSKTTVTLRPQRVAELRAKIYVKDRELCDYIAVWKDGKDMKLTFRSPEQLVYNEAAMMRQYDRAMGGHTSHENDVNGLFDKATQTIKPTLTRRRPKQAKTLHSQLYFYRYV
eukprot:sb/3472379/